MIKITHSVKAGIAFIGVLLFAVFFVACDTLENDSNLSGPKVEIVNKQVYVVSNGTSYIDLSSIVKTQGRVRLDISAQPKKGKLKELATGLLRYAPFNDFTKGRDAFVFSVFNQHNEFITSDSVVIIVDDSTHLPCSFYPQDDFVDANSSSVEVSVLNNDVLCGGDDSADVVLQLYNFNPAQHQGVATIVNGNRIRYTENSAGQALSDSIIYKVSKRSNPNVVGYATLYVSLNQAQVCNFTVNPDNYSFKKSVAADTVTLGVLVNDIFCDSLTSLQIIENTVHGDAWVNGDNIRYVYLSAMDSTTYVDTLAYRVCIGTRCDVGRVKILLTK